MYLSLTHKEREWDYKEQAKSRQGISHQESKRRRSRSKVALKSIVLIVA
jgi:hypothetical protein